MPDDGSGNKDERGRGGSLVERAMRGARSVRRAQSVTDAGSSPLEAQTDVVDPDPPIVSPPLVLREPDPAIEPAGPREAPAGVAAPDEATAQSMPERALAQRTTSDPAPHSQSRVVDLDFGRLQKMGFITPNRERTRTTEEFRLIKRAILQGISAARAEGRRNPNLVMVTSAIPNEGKSFNAINLAISIASEPDLNTLLVDADLVNPSIFETLGIEPGRGLVDIIESGDFNLSDVLVRTNIDGLTLLGAGTLNAMATELIASERMHRFVDEVAQRYKDRIVIFDAPPILATSEASVLTEHMSQIAFVIEADRTSHTQAKEAVDMIGPGPRVGLVLNKASARFGARQFGAYYKPYSKD